MKSILAAFVVVSVAVLAAGCGASSSSSTGTSGVTSASGVSTAPPPTPTSCSTNGGTLTILSAGDVDHIDPGQAYYSFPPDGSCRRLPEPPLELSSSSI
jgi:hypothetical protein